MVVGCWFLFFFFQAEDGIRDLTVTGVQTCALPIWGSGTIDGHEDDPARCGAIRTRVHHHVLDIAGGSLQRGVPEARVYPVKAAERPEAGENVSIRTAWRPEVGSENPLAAEDAEVICLGDGARDVVPAAVLVFGDGDLHAREFGVDLGLEPAQDVDRTTAKFIEDPRIAIVVVVERGIPQVARTLHDKLDLGIGEVVAQVEDPRSAGVVYLDRKSTRLNSSHSQISYAVFCLKKKKTAGHRARRHMCMC